MYICIVSNTYRIGKVRIEYVSYRLLTVSSQPYKWGSEFGAGDQVLHGYYHEQVGKDFLHQRLVKNTKATVPATSVIYICSEMAATDTFVVEESLHRRNLKCMIESDFARLAI